MGLESVGDLLTYFPRRYTDKREVTPIIEVKDKEPVVLRGKITSITSNARNFRRRMSITTALISDATGTIEAVWFNQPYLSQQLKKGSEVFVAGKARFHMKKGNFVLQSPEVELVAERQIHAARIVPVYHETELDNPKAVGRISSKWIREKLFPLLPFAEYFEEFLPEDILSEHNLISYSEAVRHAHFPSSEKKLQEATHRLAFNELFLLQLAALYKRYWWRKEGEKHVKKITPDWELIKKFLEGLQWPLTGAQKRSIYEIIKDFEQKYPMSRLLEGDVGAGKTVVAAAAAFHVIRSGYQVCLLAPTEILARQHLKTLRELLTPHSIQVHLLVGSTPEKEKKEIRSSLKSGEIQFAVGTHALLQEKIGFQELGLAIIDEQHRFGVKQRELLKTHGSPHILNLTATPIPRTLALILYGEQELSILDEMPPGRQKIITRIVTEQKRNDAYSWISKQIESGRQAFVICPLVAESEKLDIKAATAEYERLQEHIFPNLRVGLLHGQMKAADKEEQMKKFVQGELEILVSTAVVEVGIDVPNATIMVIEGAERFGLAQLHQFRGRVGRGIHQSYCLLFPSSYSDTAMKRLSALTKYSSGFKLAEIDLQLRGPGEVYGTSQSGIPDLKMASFGDLPLVKKAREAAEKIIEKDPELTQYTSLREKVAENANIGIDF